MRRMLLVGVALGVALTACEMRAEVVVDEDGSGTIGMAFGMEPFVANSLPSMPGADPFEFFADEVAKTGLPWRFEEFDEPGLAGTRATLAFSSFEDLKQKVDELSSGDVGTGFGETFDISRTPGGGWSLRATSGPVEPSLEYDGDDGLTPKYLPPPSVPTTAPDSRTLLETFGQEDFDPSEFTGPNPLEGFDQLFRVEFHVTLPGKPAETNAGETIRKGRSTTFVWRLGEGADGMELVATTTPAPPALPVLPIGIALGAIGGGTFWMLRRKNHTGGPPPVVLEGFHPSPTSSDTGGGAPEVVPAGAVEASPVSATTLVVEPGTQLVEPGSDELAG